MKNATRYCAGPAYYRCAQQTFTVQNKPAAVAPKETITHHFSVSGIGQKKLLMQSATGGGKKKNVKVKTENPANIRNDCSGLAISVFYTRWKRVYCSQ